MWNNEARGVAEVSYIVPRMVTHQALKRQPQTWAEFVTVYQVPAGAVQ